MARDRPRPIVPLVENVTESATACLLAMTQGNLLTLTLPHWLIASRTGLLAGTAAAAALWLVGERRRWAIAALLTLTTVGADYLSHPSHFGGRLGEAHAIRRLLDNNPRDITRDEILGLYRTAF